MSPGIRCLHQLLEPGGSLAAGDDLPGAGNTLGQAARLAGCIYGGTRIQTDDVFCRSCLVGQHGPDDAQTVGCIFGMQRADLSALKAEDAADSLRIIRSVLANEAGPAKDIVCLNAGAAIYAAGKAGSLAEGVARAGEVIASGEAAARLEQLVQATNAR